MTHPLAPFLSDLKRANEARIAELCLLLSDIDLSWHDTLIIRGKIAALREQTGLIEPKPIIMDKENDYHG